MADGDQVSGFSDVTEEEVSPIVDSTGKPIRKSPKKTAKKNVSAKRSSRRTRQ